MQFFRGLVLIFSSFYGYKTHGWSLYMSQSYNYIKVKSRKQLQRENETANLTIYKAGTHSTLPGGTHMPIGRFSPEGVAMPPDQSPTTNGDALTGTTRHSWTPYAGIGAGHVDSPSTSFTPPIDPMPNRSEEGTRAKMRRSGRTDRPGPGYAFTAANRSLENSSAFAGALDAMYTEGSVGRDINMVARIKKARARSRR